MLRHNDYTINCLVVLILEATQDIVDNDILFHAMPNIWYVTSISFAAISY